MEGLKLRAIALGVALIGAGAFISMSPATSLVKRDEPFLEKKAPMKVGSFIFQPNLSSPKPEQSYEVSEDTYKILQPFGVVGRVYRDGNLGYDVLLIASNKKESFHDQRVCFAAQGWNLIDQHSEQLDTVRGKINLTIAEMSHEYLGKQLAVLFYKGPGDRFYATPQELAFAMFKEQLFGGSDLEAVFYRFIPTKEGTSKEELFAFVQSYVKEAKNYSGGYF